MNQLLLRPGGLELTKQAATAAKLTADSRVLDIGCGVGDSLFWLQQTYGCFTAGVDRSEKAIRETEKRLGFLESADHQLVIADANALPYKDAFFDLVMMECTLTLFDDPGKALQEALRVLRPDGMLYISALIRKSTPPAGYSALVDQGLLVPDELMNVLEQADCQIIDQKDQNGVLVQFVADAIFTFGSLDEYVRQATEAAGGCVFDCAVDPKHAGYACYYIKKNERVSSIL